MTCVGYGAPNPEIMWLKGGIPVTSNGHISIHSTEIEKGGILFIQSNLEICNIEIADESIYSCVATNEEGSETRSFPVTVEPRGSH